MAGNLLGSADIQDGSIRSVDIMDGKVKLHDLAPKAVTTLQGHNGVDGKNGVNGKDGKDGLLGAFYATAFYNAGDTNTGAIATVACDANSSAFTAIAGGVQVTGLDAGASARNTPVSSSFPGRMDWDGLDDIAGNADDNTPRANRLDGWIVQFGGNAGATADKDPQKVKVWALCVPNTSIPVHQTYTQVG